MKEKTSDLNVKTIEIKADSDNEFLLLHGYTGNPNDFNRLPMYLHKRFNVNIKVALLKDHEKEIKKIVKLKYKDFFLQAEKDLKQDLAKDRKIILIGISLGGLISLQLSAKYPVKSVICIAPPYKNRFLTKIVLLFLPIIFKKMWKKPVGEYEKRLRKKDYHYFTDLRGLRIVRQAKKELKNILDKINSPSFIIHTYGDKIFHPKSAGIISKKINSKIKEVYIFNEKGVSDHNPFFSKNHEKLYKAIGDFVEENKLFEN